MLLANNGLVRYTLKGLVAYYHINSLAKNLYNTSKPGNIEKSLLLMHMCKEYEKALRSCYNMLHLFAAFDDEVKTTIIKRVLDDVKMSNVTFGLRTGLLASKELVDSELLKENSQAVEAGKRAHKRKYLMALCVIRMALCDSHNLCVMR